MKLPAKAVSIADVKDAVHVELAPHADALAKLDARVTGIGGDLAAVKGNVTINSRGSGWPLAVVVIAAIVSAVLAHLWLAGRHANKQLVRAIQAPSPAAGIPANPGKWRGDS